MSEAESPPFGAAAMVTKAKIDSVFITLDEAAEKAKIASECTESVQEQISTLAEAAKKAPEEDVSVKKQGQHPDALTDQVVDQQGGTKGWDVENYAVEQPEAT